MPRGSKIGERRGGRQRGTPNRRTVLAGRILAITPESPTTSAAQCIAILVKDQALPADIRRAIARNFFAAGKSQFVGVGTARSSAGKRRKSAGRAPSDPAQSIALGMLFSIAQDPTVPLDQRHKAAAEAAQHLLPKKPGIKRWWLNAPVDEYGFAITPEIAAEYRDIKIELRRLAESGANGPAIRRKEAKMRQRLKTIRHRLQCSCPSLYGMDQWNNDGQRVVYFLRKRDAKRTLSEEEDAQEAHRTARFYTFVGGPEATAVVRFNRLQNKERFGPRLTWKETTDLRFLRSLYPTKDFHYDPDFHEFDGHPFRNEPAEDGNFYPPHSKLRPLKDGDIEEFVEVPPYCYPPNAKLPDNPPRLYVHRDFPGYRWAWR
jgi:hypothetical protein